MRAPGNTGRPRCFGLLPTAPLPYRSRSLAGKLGVHHRAKPNAMNGYSDRTNHALAYAAKHHDQQVRKGTRLPYLTHGANVALILTRYGCDETTVVAGILHDVIEDCVREGWTHAMLESRIGEKFGDDALATVLAVTKRRLDDDGNEMDRDERNADHLARLGSADDRGKWVCAADNVHNANTILADLRRTMDPMSVWGRFSGGRNAAVANYRAAYDRLNALGFSAAIMAELRTTVEQIEAAA